MQDDAGIVRQILSRAHASLQAGNPRAAYEEVVTALKLLRNDALTESTLSRAWQEFTDDHVPPNIDDLTHLMNKISLDSSPSASESSDGVPLDGTSSILAETGRECINELALKDGSCVQCVRCGAIIVTARQEAHNRYWCPSPP